MIRDKIIEIRQKNRLKQAEFGKILNLTPDQVSRIERGKQEVDLKVLIGLAKHFDVNLHELITDENIKQSDETELIELRIENRVLRELIHLPAVRNKKNA